MGTVARKYAHKIPYVLKFNHNEFLSYPNTHDQILFASVKQAFDMGCVGVGATVYFGSAESKRQIQEITHAFQIAHEMGMFTILWCYIRNAAFKTKEKDYHFSADLTGHPPILPEWATGFWQCKLRYRTQDELLDALRQLVADRQLRDRLGAAGRTALARVWSEDAHIEAYFAAIDGARALRAQRNGNGTTGGTSSK